MMTFRRLADSGRGIVVVTHATSSLSLCDTVVVMGPGGFVLFNGSPPESLEHFQVAAYDEIYNAIDLADVPVPPPAPSTPRERRVRTSLLSGRSLFAHTATLTARYAKTLVISTLARSVDQATSLIPLLLIPQLLFGAALVPFARMSALVKGIADLMVSRWAFASTGHTIHMSTRLADAPKVAALSGYGTSFFSLSPAVAAMILLGFTAGLLLIAAILLAKQSSAPI